MGFQPFVTHVPPNQYWAPLPTSKSKLTPFVYTQTHFCLNFVDLLWYILKFRVPPVNCLRTPGWESLI